MNASNKNSDPPVSGSHRMTRRGFALVVTLSLMILLTVIAVGLLSLSAVSLRSSSQGMAQAEAQANARLALMLAIGDLQKSLGPDRAITATSEILATPTAAVAKPNTTGVWESWDLTNDLKNGSSPAYSTEKTSRFRRWLVSSADMAAPQSRDFVTTAWTGKTIELVGNGSLGTTAPAAAKVTAGLVPVSKNGKVQGSYGWHVSDESVKARINLYRDPSQNATLAQKRALLAGHRPDPSVLKSSDGSLLTNFPTDLSPAEFADATASIGKVIDLDQAELLDQAKGKIKPFRNDITPYSLGVLTDVRGGGLKQDLSSVFEMGSATANTLPTEFTNKKLYASTHGITDTSPTSSDPNWSALAGYYNSFRSLTNAETNPTFAVKPPEPLQQDNTINPVPVEYNPAPVIAKVDTIFSLVARPLSDVSWLGSEVTGTYQYSLNLIFTPLVTLHNPYNFNISFHKMDVEFANVPIAFNVMFSAAEGGGFLSQSVDQGNFESLNTMASRNYPTIPGLEKMRGDKSFKMTIANWSNTKTLSTDDSTSGNIVLKPGQTLLCGPVFPPTSSYAVDNDGIDATEEVAFDWKNQLIQKIKAGPEYTPGAGYEVYAVTIKHYRNPPSTLPPIKQVNRPNGTPWFKLYAGAWPGQPFMLLRDSGDQFYLECKLQTPSWYDGDSTTNPTPLPPLFEVKARLQASNNSAAVDYARLEFKYKDSATIQNKIENRVFRYPPTGSYGGGDVSAPPGTKYSQQLSFVHPFAIFSANARTTSGGVYETRQRSQTSGASNRLLDGRLAGKPFLFHNPSRTNFSMDVEKEKPGVQAYELNFQPFTSPGDFQDYLDVDNSRIPSLTGNKSGTGIKSGSYLELPSGPLQAIADFRRSNALTTSYLPHFVQPVANSRLHPLMSADKVIETNTSITATQMLDHSVLANHALYDRFYFSTFATRGTTTKPDVVFEQFMNDSAPLASQSFMPYLSGGKTVATAKAELFSSGTPNNDAYKTAAEYQMIRGPFNVNSTSVQAWKAVLAAMNKSDVSILWASTAALETQKATGAAVTAMSLLNGGGIISGPLANEAARSNNWNGYRELTEPQLQTLAEKIVEEVRDRGPFLSMSEFVNRQVGPTGARTLKGALEAAIMKSEINEKQNATSAVSFLEQVPITAADVSDSKLYDYKTPEATTGNPAAGAPGWVNQGDLLRILEPGATVRGDTFVIRTYGEARDASGINITARAYAEAVVQRVPEYVDPADRPSLNASSVGSAAKATNKTFGRRFNVVSFRWLSGNEI